VTVNFVAVKTFASPTRAIAFTFIIIADKATFVTVTVGVSTPRTTSYNLTIALTFILPTIKAEFLAILPTEKIAAHRTIFAQAPTPITVKTTTT
jgi:hypothetical protein